MQSDDNKTPLILASEIGDVPMIKILLDAKADVRTKQLSGDTALLSAIKFRNDDAVCLLADKCDRDTLNVRDEQQLTALMILAAEGRSKCVEAILKAGADLDLQDPAGRPALVIAFTHDRTESFSIIAKAGADVDVQDEKGETLLMLAAKRDKPDFVRRMIEASARPELVDKKGNTAL